MSVNTMTFEQSAAFLTALYEEATGQQPVLQVADTKTFTTVGTTLLQGGLDPIISGLCQVMDRTIFAMRTYDKRFEDLTWDEIRWGAVTRKISFIDTALDSTDDRLSLIDGQSIDPYTVKKPKVIQMMYYGNTVYQDSITIFRDQLDSALRDANEFGRFISGLMTNISNKHKQIEEAEARGMLANFITAKALADPDNAINVLQAYYDETGVVLTPDVMFKLGNYSDFTRWLAGFLETLVDKLGERSIKYHMNVTGSEVMRFTRGYDLKKYISANVANYLNTMVSSGLYNPDRLGVITEGMRKVTFWQNLDNPYSVQARPAYIDVSDGEIINATDPVQVDNIIGVLFDRDALGMVKRSTWSAATPFNPKGGYYNIFWHWTQQTVNSFDENFILLYAGTVVVPEIELSDATITLANVGDTDTLTATTVPADAVVYYQSSDETIATVSDAGVVTAVATGTATITGYIVVAGRTYSDTCEVTVS